MGATFLFFFYIGSYLAESKLKLGSNSSLIHIPQMTRIQTPYMICSVCL